MSATVGAWVRAVSRGRPSTRVLVAGALSTRANGAGRVLVKRADPSLAFPRRPVLLAAGAIAQATATITAQRRELTQTFEWEIRRPGRAWSLPANGTVTITTQLQNVSTTFDALERNTEYVVQARAHQAGLPPSEWSEDLRFTTAP